MGFINWINANTCACVRRECYANLANFTKIFGMVQVRLTLPKSWLTVFRRECPKMRQKPLQMSSSPQISAKNFQKCKSKCQSNFLGFWTMPDFLKNSRHIVLFFAHTCACPPAQVWQASMMYWKPQSITKALPSNLNRRQAKTVLFVLALVTTARIFRSRMKRKFRVRPKVYRRRGGHPPHRPKLARTFLGSEPIKVALGSLGLPYHYR